MASLTHSGIVGVCVMNAYRYTGKVRAISHHLYLPQAKCKQKCLPTLLLAAQQAAENCSLCVLLLATAIAHASVPRL